MLGKPSVQRESPDACECGALSISRRRTESSAARLRMSSPQVSGSGESHARRRPSACDVLGRSCESHRETDDRALLRLSVRWGPAGEDVGRKKAHWSAGFGCQGRCGDSYGRHRHRGQGSRILDQPPRRSASAWRFELQASDISTCRGAQSAAAISVRIDVYFRTVLHHPAMELVEGLVLDSRTVR
jgi:hypothetical protein